MLVISTTALTIPSQKKWNPSFNFRFILLIMLFGSINFYSLQAQDAVAVEKSIIGGITSIQTGVPFQYQVTVRCDNTGVDPCTNFVLSETLPLGLEFTSATVADVFSVPGGFGTNSPPIVSNFNSGNDPTFTTPGNITLDFGDVAPGASAVISFNVRFHKGGDIADGYSVNNTVTLTSDNDINTGNNSTTSPAIAAQASPNWLINKNLSSNFALGSTTTYELNISGSSVGGNFPYYSQSRAGHLALYNPIVVDILEAGLTCADVDATITSGMSTGDAICLAPNASGTLTSGITFTNPSATNYALVFDHEAIFPTLTAPYRPNPTIPVTGTAGNSIGNQDIQVGIVYDTPPFVDAQNVTNRAELWGSFPTSLGATSLTPIAFLDEDEVIHTVNDPIGDGFFEKLNSGQTVYVGGDVDFSLRLENIGNIPMTDVVFRDTLPSEMGDLSTIDFSGNGIEDKTITLTFTDGTTQAFTLLNGDNDAAVNTDFTIPAGEQVEIIEAAIDGNLLPGGGNNRWTMSFDGTVLSNRWRDDNYTARYDNPNQSPDIDVGIQLSGSSVMDDEELTNCGHYTATTTTGTLSGSDCAFKMLTPKYVAIIPSKSVSPSTPQAPGTTLTFTLTYGGFPDNASVPYDDITTLTLVDTLPLGLTYVPNSAVPLSTAIITSTTHILDVNGTGRELLIFEIDRNGSNARLSSSRISFQAVIEGNHPAGTYENTHFITDFTGNNNTVAALTTWYDYPLDIRIDTTGFTTPLAGSAPNDISAPPPYNGADEAYQVVSLPAGNSIKFVDADLTPGQTGSGGVELGSPGSTATFTLLFENSGNDTLQDLRLIDLLPRIGDESPLTCTPRNTAWEPDFAGNITANFISNGVTTSVSPTIEYSTDTDPCVAYWVPGSEPCGACNAGTFTNSPPATLGDVLALGLDFGTLKIPPSDSILVSFDVDIPLSPTPEGIAWNTFAWSGMGVISGAEVGAEPPLVGISADEFDLALTKMVSASTPGPYAPSNIVSFDIRVVNQGGTDGFDIDVLDYFNAAELNFVSFSNPTTTAGGNPVTITVTDADGSDGTTGFEISDLAEADEVTITATFTIDAAFSGTSINNDSEIVDGSVFDGGDTTFDIDSDLALTGGNGSGEIDNDIDDSSNGGTDTASDQDDFDFAQISVGSSCTNPTVTAYALPPSCTNGVPNNDGYLTITEVINGDRYHFSIGSTFDGFAGSLPLTYANASPFGTFPEETTANLDNPTGSQDYTIRVYNGANDCFTDYTVTMQEQDCMTGCDCDEYIYLNEVTPSSGGVHKFDVMTDGTLTEIGSPWFSNNAVGEELTSPHGLGVDLNGFVYIGETSSGDIRKFTCDGTILPEIDFVINDGAYNFVSYKNSLFINRNATGIEEYNLCDGTLTAVHQLDGLSTFLNWGLTIDGSTIYATTNFTNASTSKMWIFDAETNNPAVPVPIFLQEGTQTAGTLAIGDNFLPRTPIQGIDVDGLGNMYIVQKNTGSVIAGMPANSSRILKYSPVGILLAVSDWDITAGSTYPGETDPNNRGYFAATGLVYSETNNLLYIATISPAEDCVALMDTDLNYLGAAVPYTNSGQAKGIAITDECCPSPLRQNINEILCGASISDKFFLNEIFPCEGIVCGASWTPDAGNTGMTYDACDQSITITSAGACGSFIKQGATDQCGAFDLTFNLEALDITAPVITGDAPTCSNSNNPAAFTITTPASGSGTISYRWQNSMTDCTTGFMDIAGAPTDATPYDPPMLSQETHYRVITEVAGTCSSGMCADTSNCVTLTPVSLPSLSATPSNPTACGSCDGSISLSFNDVPPETYTINYEDASGTAQTFDNVTVASGSFQFANITNLCAGTYNNLTITVSGCPSPLGVNVSLIETCDDYDYGDLPDISSGTSALNYQTTSANNGPAHLIISGLHIGASVDSETDGQASTNAYGDGADEDGYNFPANLNISAGSTLNLPINLTNTTGTIAHLEAWIDWNGDGDFDDANEMVIDISDDGAGNFGMTHTPIGVPSNAIQSQKIGLRFRLSHTDNMTPYGSVSTGEIEDYLIQIECKSKTCLPVQLTIQRGIN